MSTVIIIGGGGHNNITRVMIAGVTGQLTEEQQSRFDALMQELQSFADEVDPR